MAVGQTGHPLHRHGALLEVHHEVAYHGDHLGQHADVDDEQGEIADRERARLQAVGRRQQDQAGAKRGRVPEERMERLTEQSIANGGMQPLLVQFLHMREHVFLGSCKLNGLDAFHGLADRSGDLLGRSPAGLSEATNVLGHQSCGHDHRE